MFKKSYFFQFFFNSSCKKLVVWGVDDANLNDIVPDIIGLRKIYQKNIKVKQIIYKNHVVFTILNL